MFGLGHIDMTPLIYGVIMFFGIWSMFAKLMSGKFTALIVEVIVFIIVFKLHGGTMAGGFSAMICALLCGMFLPRKIK